MWAATKTESPSSRWCTACFWNVSSSNGYYDHGVTASPVQRPLLDTLWAISGTSSWKLARGWLMSMTWAQSRFWTSTLRMGRGWIWISLRCSFWWLTSDRKSHGSAWTLLATTHQFHSLVESILFRRQAGQRSPCTRKFSNKVGIKIQAEHTCSLNRSSISSSNPTTSRSKMLFSTSPGNLIPLLRPGATSRSCLLFTEELFFSPGSIISSRPPGRNGTYPDFPRTKFCAGAGVRLMEVEVSPVVLRLIGVWLR